MTSVCGLITWACIVRPPAARFPVGSLTGSEQAYTYIRFYNGCNLQGIDRNDVILMPQRIPKGL